MKSILELFIAFFKIGAFTFGGGYAMMPLIQEELIHKRQWVTNEEVLDYYAIAQMTPGIIAVNTATFIGYKLKGLPGAIMATLGVVAPSIVIITLIATVFDTLMENPFIDKAFVGIRIVVVALIASGVVQLAQKSLIDKITVAIFIIALAIMVTLSPSPVFLIIAGAITGLVVNSKESKTP